MTIFELHGRNADLQFVRDEDGETKATKKENECLWKEETPVGGYWVTDSYEFLSFGKEIQWPGFTDWKECHIGFVAGGNP
jgi:hypothetical protein